MGDFLSARRRRVKIVSLEKFVTISQIGAKMQVEGSVGGVGGAVVLSRGVVQGGGVVVARCRIYSLWDLCGRNARWGIKRREGDVCRYLFLLVRNLGVPSIKA